MSRRIAWTTAFVLLACLWRSAAAQTASVCISDGGDAAQCNSRSVTLANTVTLTNSNNAGVVTWLWELKDKPGGSTATLTGATTNTATFVADREGSYLIKLTINAALSSKATNTRVPWVLQRRTSIRIPAAGETTEVDATRGWSADRNSGIQVIEREALEGRVNCRANSAIAAGTPVRTLSVEPIASLNNANLDYIAVVGRATATTAATVAGLLYAQDAIASGALGRCWRLGHATSPLTTTGAAKGDPIYVSNAAALSLTAGTIPAQIGSVVEIGTNARIYVDAQHGQSLAFGGAPPSVATAGAAGTNATVSRSDHTHSGVDLSTAQTVGGQKTFTSAVLLPDGTVSLPALARSAETSTGLWFPTTGQCSVSASGSEVFRALIGTSDNGLISNGRIFRFPVKPSSASFNYVLEAPAASAGCGFGAGALNIYGANGCAAGAGNGGQLGSAVGLTAGVGGASDGSSAAAVGNSVIIRGGAGGAGSAAIAGARGGPALVVGGAGGAGGASSAAGAGYAVEIVSGAAGAAGSSGANAGDLWLASGNASGSGTKGAINICSATASPTQSASSCSALNDGATTTTLDTSGTQTIKKADAAAGVGGYTLNITGSAGGAASGATPGGLGGSLFTTAGNGGAAGASAAAGAGGGLYPNAGNGGAASGANAAGVGGEVGLYGGTGGDGSASTAAGRGGNVTLGGGIGGAVVGGGAGGAGGLMTVQGGRATGSATGGKAQLIGGDAAITGAYGGAAINAGSGGGAGKASITIGDATGTVNSITIGNSTDNPTITLTGVYTWAPSKGGTGANNAATSGRYLKGDGTNFVTSNGSASGTGACPANQFVTTLNSDAAPTCAAGSAAGAFIGTQVLTSGTTYTPTAGTNTVTLVMLAGGGGGGGAKAGATAYGGAGGGGAGSICVKTFGSVSGSYTIAIGGGGAGGSGTPSDGSAGGNTTFTNGGTTYTANGGTGGAQVTASAAAIAAKGGGAAAVSTNCDVNASGSGGAPGFNGGGKAAGTWNGSGGSSPYGGGGSSVVNATGTGAAGVGYGSGGAGGITVDGATNATGGAGAGGLIIVYEYK